MMIFTKTIILLFFLIFGFSVVSGQSSINRFLKPSDSLNKPRRDVVLIAEGALFTIGVVQISGVTEKGHLNSNFHFMNDNESYLQMDKSAHIFSSYQFSSYASEALKWGGMSQKGSLIYGAGLGYLFLTTIELMDGFVETHGASPGDLIANTIGSSLYVSQELIWKEQRIVPKFSFQNADFVSSNSETMKSQIVGEYNGQTYWLSANIYSFVKKSKIPRWLNVAFGHGVEGVGTAQAGNITPVGAYHQYYLSLDMDLTKIRTKSHVLKTAFFLFNYLKVPAPAFEFDSNGGVKLHYMYF